MSPTNDSIEFEFPALKEAVTAVDAKAAELAEIFKEAGPDIDLAKVSCITGTTVEKSERITQLNDELTDLGKERDRLVGVARAAKASAGHDPERPGGQERGDDRPGGAGEAKSFGDHLLASKAYREKRGSVGPEDHLDFELKTLFQTSAGWTPETTRTGRVVEFATRPIEITDLVPQTTTKQTSVVYMEETVFTNNASETDEGGTYAEVELALTEKSSGVRKITAWLPITDEQLEDEEAVRNYVNNRLPFMVRQRLDGQILVGSGAGTPTQLRGFLNTAGIQTQAKGADPVPDAVYKAMVKVRTTGQAIPSAYVTNPLDWQDVRLLRTADGIYIWGNPADAGPERIWGLQVVQAQAETENTGLVGDFANFTELAIKRGMDVQISNSHAGFFIDGKQALRADMRCALTVYRPAALCKVTGI